MLTVRNMGNTEQHKEDNKGEFPGGAVVRTPRFHC